MKVLRSPAVIVLLGTLVGAAAGLWTFHSQARVLVAAAAARPAAEREASRPEKPWDFWTPEVEKLAQELTAARAELAQRDATLTAREARLADELAELDKVRQQIESLRADISNRIVQVQTQELRNLKTLAATYSLLTPKAAVAIFGELDDVAVVKLLSLMKPEVAAALLEEISRTPGDDNANVKRAAELSQRLRLLLPATPVS